MRDLPFKLTLTLSSAIAIGIAFPPSNHRWLAWFALVPLLIALRSCSTRTAFSLGAIWGMAGAWGITSWLPPTVSNYYGQPVWLGYLLFTSAAFSMGAVYYGLFAVIHARLSRSDTAWSILFSAAAWVTAELCRSRVLTGNPWGLLGYTQGPFTRSKSIPLTDLLNLPSAYVVQVADLGGVYLVSFVLFVANAGLARRLIKAWSHEPHEPDRKARSGTLTQTAVAAIVTAFAICYGVARHATPFTDESSETPLAIVQADLDLGARWDSSMYGKNLREYLKLTSQVLDASTPAVVVWPENAMTFFLDDEPLYRRAIARVIGPADAQLVSGAPRYEKRDSFVYFNSAFSIAPNGDIVDHYDKQHLLPFAEYFPLSSSDLMRRSFGRVREFTRGIPAGPLDTRAGPAGVLICNEAMFPRLATPRIREGAEYFINLSNDTWLNDDDFALHHFSMVGMRSVEHRRYLVRASTSGPSGIIDPHGNVMTASRPGSRSTVEGVVRRTQYRTLYSRIGDMFAWTCAFVTLVVGLSLWLQEQRTS